MFDWISQNKDVLNVLIGFATLMVWVVYAQLLYNGYKRQRRPRIVINRGRYKGVDALCLISNMSAESIFVQHIVARLETDKGDYFQDVTELEQNYQEGDEERERQSTSDTPSLSDSTRQGPLGPVRSTASSSASPAAKTCVWTSTAMTGPKAIKA